MHGGRAPSWAGPHRHAPTGRPVLPPVRSRLGLFSPLKKDSYSGQLAPSSLRATDASLAGRDSGSGDAVAAPARINWLGHWYPISFEEDIDRSKPYRFVLLGVPLVVWFDGQWRAFKDVCPHRCARRCEATLERSRISVQLRGSLMLMLYPRDVVLTPAYLACRRHHCRRHRAPPPLLAPPTGWSPCRRAASMERASWSAVTTAGRSAGAAPASASPKAATARRAARAPPPTPSPSARASSL